MLLGVLCLYYTGTTQPFVKVIKKAGEQEIRNQGIEHYDGGYIVIENDVSINYVRKYTQNCNLLWQKRLKGGKNGDYTRNVRMTKDSGFIGVGTSYKYYNKNSNDGDCPVIVRYDKCGNVVWKKILVSDTAYLATECIELNNGDIVVLTLYPGNAANIYYTATMLFSPQGKLKTYRANNFEHLWLNLSNDSNYFYALGAAWYMSPTDSNSYYRFPAISKYRSDNLNLVYQMPTAFDTYVGAAGIVLSEKDPAHLKVVGSVAIPLYMTLFDFDVQNKKASLLKNYTPKGLILQGGDALVSPNRDYVVTTEWADTFNKQTNKTTRLLDIRIWDTLNNLQYHVRPTGYKWDLSFSIILRDKRILVSGKVWDSANQYTDSYFLRFKPDLSWDSFRTDTTHYDFACGSPPTSEDITFTAADTIHIDNDSYNPANISTTSIATMQEPILVTCWPNPAHDELFVGIAGETKDYDISLYDMEGRLLAYPIAQSYNCYLFNTSNLSTGVYIIQMLHKHNGTAARYKFVKN